MWPSSDRRLASQLYQETAMLSFPITRSVQRSVGHIFLFGRQILRFKQIRTFHPQRLILLLQKYLFSLFVEDGHIFILKHQVKFLRLILIRLEIDIIILEH